MIKINIFKCMYISKCHNNVAACFVPPHMRAQPKLICKLYFTKNIFLTFFLKNIWTCQKKAVLLHRN